MSSELIKDMDVLASDASSMISIKTLLLSLMNEFGGPNGVAHELKRDFDEAPIGSPLRVRIGTVLLSAIERFGETSADDDEDTIEDKENLLRKLLSENERRSDGVGDAG